MIALRRFPEIDVSKVRVPMDAAAATAWDGEGGGAFLARELVRAIRVASASVKVSELEEALRSRSPRRALGLFALADAERDVIEPAARESLWRAYALGIVQADRLARLVQKARTPLFAVRDERAILRLISQGNALSQRYLARYGTSALEVVIREAALRGLDWKRVAQLIVRGNLIGLDEGRAGAVIRYLHAQIKAGVRLDVAHKRAEAYGRRLLRQRAEVLARTEIQRVLNVGAVDGWLDLRSRGLISGEAVVVWHVRPAACPLCSDVSGEVVRLGEVFSNGLRYPPVHPNCRCVLELRIVPGERPRRRRSR